MRRLVAAVCALGLASVVVALVSAFGSSSPDLGRVALAVAVILAGDVALIHLKFGANRISWTFGEAALVAGLVILPSPWLVVVAPLGVAAAHLLARRSPIKVAYNAMTSATAVLLARGAYGAVAGGADAADLGRSQTWLGLVVAALVFALWNGLSISAAVGASSGIAWLEVFRQGGLMRLLSYVGNTAAALALVAMQDAAPVALILVPVVFGGLQLAYQAYLRVTQEPAVWAGVPHRLA